MRYGIYSEDIDCISYIYNIGRGFFRSKKEDYWSDDSYLDGTWNSCTRIYVVHITNVITSHLTYSLLIEVLIMETAIIYYSKHHGNTKKLLDAISSADPSLTLIDVTEQPDANLSAYDRIGFASGIYFTSFAKQILSFAESHLPENKDVFYIYTHGAPVGGFLKSIREIAEKKYSRELGAYHCLGFDTFGPFKVVGGIAKGHPNEEEIAAAVRFYQEL